MLVDVFEMLLMSIWLDTLFLKALPREPPKPPLPPAPLAVAEDAALDIKMFSE
jgi:hypothetical protein